MKRETKVMLDRAATVARLIAQTLEENDKFTSADCLDLDVACADLRQLINDAHHSEFGL